MRVSAAVSPGVIPRSMICLRKYVKYASDHRHQRDRHQKPDHPLPVRPGLRQNPDDGLAVELRGKFFFFEFDVVGHD